jgi:hypothetical protein
VGIVFVRLAQLTANPTPDTSMFCAISRGRTQAKSSGFVIVGGATAVRTSSLVQTREPANSARHVRVHSSTPELKPPAFPTVAVLNPTKMNAAPPGPLEFQSSEVSCEPHWPAVATIRRRPFVFATHP